MSDMCIIYMYKYHAIELWRHVAERAEFPRNRARGYVDCSRWNPPKRSRWKISDFATTSNNSYYGQSLRFAQNRMVASMMMTVNSNLYIYIMYYMYYMFYILYIFYV